MLAKANPIKRAFLMVFSALYIVFMGLIALACLSVEFFKATMVFVAIILALWLGWHLLQPLL